MKHNISITTISHFSSSLCRVKSAKIHGTSYHKNVVVVCGMAEDDSPMFGSIQDIVVVCHECFFVICPLVVVCYHHHYHAYEVKQDNSCVVFKYEQLLNYHPLVCTNGQSGQVMVSPKYHLF